MKNVSRLLASATAVFCAAVPGVSEAQSITNTCGGNNYFVCFSLTDWLIGSGTNGLNANQLQFRVTNNTAAAYAPATFTEFLIGGIGRAYSLTNIQASDGQDYREVSSTMTGSAGNSDNSFSGQGFVQGTNFLFYNNNGNQGIARPSSVLFTLTLGSNIISSDFVNGNSFRSSIQFGVHAQGSSICGGSSKLVVNGNGSVATTSTTAQGCTTPGGGITGQVVPEPSTYALLATGLGALGMVAQRRRKQQQG